MLASRRTRFPSALINALESDVAICWGIGADTPRGCSERLVRAPTPHSPRGVYTTAAPCPPLSYVLRNPKYVFAGHTRTGSLYGITPAKRGRCKVIDASIRSSCFEVRVYKLCILKQIDDDENTGCA